MNIFNRVYELTSIFKCYSPGGCKLASSSITGTKGFFSFTTNFFTDVRFADGRILSVVDTDDVDDGDVVDVVDDDDDDDGADDVDVDVDDDGFGDF